MAKGTELNDELRPEYDETLLKNGIRGKYAKEYAAGTNIIGLTPEQTEEVREALEAAKKVWEALEAVEKVWKALEAAGTNIVRLAPDVAAAFPNEEAVNEALRSVLKIVDDAKT